LENCCRRFFAADADNIISWNHQSYCRKTGNREAQVAGSNHKMATWSASCGFRVSPQRDAAAGSLSFALGTVLDV